MLQQPNELKIIEMNNKKIAAEGGDRKLARVEGRARGNLLREQ